jgi:competence protein ComEC
MKVTPVPVLALSLLVGSVAGSGVPYVPVTVFCVTSFFLAALFVLSRTGWCRPAFSCLVFGMFLYGVVSGGGAQVRTGSLALPQAAGSDKVTVVGEISAPVRYGPDRAVAVLAVHRILAPVEGGPLEGRLRVSIRGDAPPLFVGDLVQVQTRVRPSRGQLNPGGFDYGAYLRRAGLQAVGSVNAREGAGVQVLARVGRSLMATVDRWRGHVREATLRSLDSQTAGIYLALITGETGYLNQEVRDAFMAAGATHILSISGSHLGFVGIVVFWVVRRGVLALPTPFLLRLSRQVTATRIAAAATILPVFFYAYLAGAAVATVRSLLMLFVFLGAVWFGRLHSVGTGLAVALLLIIGWHPLAPFDISFQLSFLSVMAIVLFLSARSAAEKEMLEPPPRAQGALAWFKKQVTEAFLIGLVVTVVTAPLVAMHFNQLAWVGGVSNLVVVPFVGLLIVPLGLAACLTTLAGGLNELAVAWLLQPLLEALVWVVNGFAAIPGAELRVASPPIWQVLGFYLLLGGAFLAWGRWAGRVSIGLAVGLLFIWTWSPRELPQSGTVRVTYMDVGQGDAALIETSDGRTMLIDGGTATDHYDVGQMIIAPLLWNRGIHRLDVVVATHPQQDHIGGLAFVVRKFEVGEVWTNGVSREVSFMRRFEEVLQARGIVRRAVSEADGEMSLGSCRGRVLNPGGVSITGADNLTGEQQNNRSVVIRLGCGGAIFLFTGDVEKEAEAVMVNAGSVLRAGVLKVPHHGARGSVHEPFLSAVSPDVAVVSVGMGNSYGHPAPAMLEAYARLGIRVLRTDHDGAVTVMGTLSGIELACEASHRLQSIRWRGNGMWTEEVRNLRRAMLGEADCSLKASPLGT